MTSTARNLYRSRNDFDATVEAAAEQLGISATAVEKDYWVSEVLRSLAAAHPDDFIFKGGTSLSKAYQLVERFSEDVDVLVLPGDRGRGAVDKLMKAMGQTAASFLSGEAQPVGGTETGRHRSYEVSYPTTRPATSLIRTSVLLEMGIRGGDHPHDLQPVGSLLGDRLAATGVDLDEYDDLRPPAVNVLHPVRTLLEKLVHIDGLSTQLAADLGLTLAGRTGRHFFDVYQLLGSPMVLDRLENRDEFDTVIGDIAEVSAKWFSGTEGRPSDGFAACPAFQLGDPVGIRCQAAYERTMPELHFGANPLPAWKQVCERVQSNRNLL
ncbi:MAG: hypothetical protein JWM47_1533 [Acidimicrobiales bacterium]|nr:hypothetical protein [Acidimicrobiales bacterium]